VCKLCPASMQVRYSIWLHVHFQGCVASGTGNDGLQLEADVLQGRVVASPTVDVTIVCLR
jgi:hypothetical protein